MQSKPLPAICRINIYSFPLRVYGKCFFTDFSSMRFVFIVVKICQAVNPGLLETVSLDSTQRFQRKNNVTEKGKPSTYSF